MYRMAIGHALFYCMALTPLLALAVIRSETASRKGASRQVGRDFGAGFIDPIDFEHWCAARLRAAMWSARRNKSSGDQGGDVIAEKGDVRLAVQAKRHAAPVGNKAVQEVFGAKHAVVVGTAGFTKAAMELADSTGVLLLNASDLDRLEALLPRRRTLARRQAPQRPAARR